LTRVPDHLDSALRERIHKMLADGLKTRTEPFPEDNHQFAAVLASLQQLDSNDLNAKLVLAGFTNHPYGEEKMRCQECMYYLPHRKWCNLPELDMPVEPDWRCRLWRI
jgi:hypothetical protein